MKVDRAITIKRSKAIARLSLRVYIGGHVVVCAPMRASDELIKNFIYAKQEWLTDIIDKKYNFGISLLGAEDYQHIQDASCEHYETYKEETRQFLVERVHELNCQQWPVNQIRVKRMKTRWGSCSTKQNLNFNYKILFLTSELQDYLIIHELCHLKHPNHSKNFWYEVETMCPDFKNLDKQLRGF